MEAKLQRKYPQLQLKQMKLRLEQNGYLQRILRIEVIEYCYNDYVNKPLPTTMAPTTPVSIEAPSAIYNLTSALIVAVITK